MTLKTYQILIVDDEKDYAELDQLIFKKVEKDLHCKIQTVFADSDQSARATVLKYKHTFSVILLDLQMETKNSGIDFLKWLREDQKDFKTRIILRTAYGDQHSIELKEFLSDQSINILLKKADYNAKTLRLHIEAMLKEYDSSDDELIKILIFEDDEEIIKLYNYSLFGDPLRFVKCDIAHNTKKCTDLVLLHNPDIIIMDLHLPGDSKNKLSGIEAIKKIIQVRKESKILVTTGYFDVENVIDCFEAGARGFYKKPFSFIDLESTIESIVNGGNYVLDAFSAKAYFSKMNSMIKERV